VTEELLVTAFAAATSADGVERTVGLPADGAALPALVRRRLRGVALSAVRCGMAALAAARGPVEVVFCSRHGDLGRTRRLLAALADGQPPSPLEFSLSVHNALAGMLDLARRERTGHTSIAAGPDSFAMALIEAAARLAGDRGRAVLLLYVEEPIPQELQDHTDRSQGGTVVAALLEPSRTAARSRAVLRRAPPPGAPARESEAEARRVLAVLEGGGPVRLASRAGFEWVVEATA
jgi:hypothetical protein